MQLKQNVIITASYSVSASNYVFDTRILHLFTLQAGMTSIFLLLTEKGLHFTKQEGLLPASVYRALAL